MNIQPFVSLIFLGDDKKIPQNKSNNIKCENQNAWTIYLF